MITEVSPLDQFKRLPVALYSFFKFALRLDFKTLWARAMYFYVMFWQHSYCKSVRLRVCVCSWYNKLVDYFLIYIELYTEIHNKPMKAGGV